MDEKPWLSTKDVLEATGVSEATLRRWIRDGYPIPELRDAPRDWKGWRKWDERHVEAIRAYQASRQESQGLMVAEQIALFGEPRDRRKK